ncbi:MAG: hypothetical protein Q9223_002577 [Gallowayella weberi]
MAMPARRRALGDLSHNVHNYDANYKPVKNVGKQYFSTPTFKVPSSTFDFSSKIKRSFDEYDDEDRENVDPNMGSAKKARGIDGEAVKSRQPTIFSLTTVQADQLSESAKIARKTLGVKSKEEVKAKSVKCPGIAARHRLGSKRVVRVEPHPTNAGAPISINAALSGVTNVVAAKPEPQQPSVSNTALPSLNMAKAFAARRAAKKLLGMGENGVKGHHFRIHEDTFDEMMAILMEHHTNTLDISDDEGRGKYSDDDNKENIPPPGVPASAVRRVARRDMTDDVRSPLAHLEASLYYASGYDASSAFDAPQEELPSPDLVDLDFGSLDGEVKEAIKSKLNEVENAFVESVAGTDAACNNSNII